MKKVSKIIIVCIIIFIALIINITYFYNKKQKALEYEKKIEGITVTMIAGANKKENGDINSNSYIVKTRNNEIIVIDGGRDIDTNFLYDYIIKLGNKTVNHWYITHPHEDHVGALIKLLDEDYDIEIENLYYSFNELEWYEKYDSRGYPTEKAMIENLESPKIKNLVKCYKGQKIQMDNVETEILKIANPEITYSDNGNDSSMVFKMTAKDVNKGILFLGDSFTYSSKELLEEPDKLNCYAVQMAHRGQNGVTKEVYDAVNPKICFFNAPEWLYNNDNGNGYNSGKWKSIIVREWVKEIGAESFVAFEGDQTVRFTSEGFEKIENFNT